MAKIIITIIALIIVVGASLALVSFTPPIVNKGSIAELRELSINGDQQHILIRGKDRNNPVLIFLHGGPGMPAMFLAHAFQRPLENDFVVVHWDQRSSGKSFDAQALDQNLSTSVLLEDLLQLINYIDQEFKQSPIILLGHSHGSYLGTLFASHYPNKIDAYVGVGQVASEAKSIDLQNQFLKQWLADNQLPDEDITEQNRENLLFQSGSEIYGETSFLPLIKEALFSTEYTLNDILKVKEGSSFSSKNMNRDMVDGALMDEVLEFSVPMYFIMGQHDMVTPLSLVEEYVQNLSAPVKELIVIDKAAHFPFYSQPNTFAGKLKAIKAKHF